MSIRMVYTQFWTSNWIFKKKTRQYCHDKQIVRTRNTLASNLRRHGDFSLQLVQMELLRRITVSGKHNHINLQTRTLENSRFQSEIPASSWVDCANPDCRSLDVTNRFLGISSRNKMLLTIARDHDHHHPRARRNTPPLSLRTTLVLAGRHETNPCNFAYIRNKNKPVLGLICYQSYLETNWNRTVHRSDNTVYARDGSSAQKITGPGRPGIALRIKTPLRCWQRLASATDSVGDNRRTIVEGTTKQNNQQQKSKS
jgi:hypothetical protein